MLVLPGGRLPADGQQAVLRQHVCAWATSGRLPPNSDLFHFAHLFLVPLVALGILSCSALVAFVSRWLLDRAPTARPPLGSLSFFAPIGLGFLVLEVAPIQRFVLFLGFPTYALSVVVFALLVFTGAGSLLPGAPARPRRRTQPRWPARRS